MTPDSLEPSLILSYWSFQNSKCFHCHHLRTGAGRCWVNTRTTTIALCCGPPHRSVPPSKGRWCFGRFVLDSGWPPDVLSRPKVSLLPSSDLAVKCRLDLLDGTGDEAVNGVYWLHGELCGGLAVDKDLECNCEKRSACLVPNSTSARPARQNGEAGWQKCHISRVPSTHHKLHCREVHWGIDNHRTRSVGARLLKNQDAVQVRVCRL